MRNGGFQKFCVRLNQPAALRFLSDIERIIQFIEPLPYGAREHDARLRIPRDPDDWPVVATALASNLPSWTEDRDFFGCGVATRITNTVPIYLREDAARPPRSS